MGILVLTPPPRRHTGQPVAEDQWTKEGIPGDRVTGQRWAPRPLRRMSYGMSCGWLCSLVPGPVPVSPPAGQGRGVLSQASRRTDGPPHPAEAPLPGVPRVPSCCPASPSSGPRRKGKRSPAQSSATKNRGGLGAGAAVASGTGGCVFGASWATAGDDTGGPHSHPGPSEPFPRGQDAPAVTSWCQLRSQCQRARPPTGPRWG
jgi:hypothetical protein